MNLYRESVREGYAGLRYSATSVIGLFRPTAFFLEPAHLAQYCLVGLIIVLFDKRDAVSLKIGLLITTGIVLTTSGMGISFCALIWAIKISSMDFSSRKMIKWFVLGLLLGIVGIILLNSLGVIKLLKIRFSLTGSHSGFEGRWGDRSNALGNFNTKMMMLGEGVDSKTLYWLPGLFSFLRQTGIIGTALLVGLFFSAGYNSTKVGKLITLLYIGLTIIANIVDMTYIVFYLSVIFAFRNSKGEPD